MLSALAAGWVGAREGLMLAAPALQFLFYRWRIRRTPGARPDELTHDDCTTVTWLGAALLAIYLVGTQAWLAAEMPANVFLR